MSGKKSDHGDAVTLANILRTDADQHRRLPADTELAQSITVLARRIRTPPGGAAGPVTNCCRCCESTFRVYWRLSPSAPAESPHPKPEQEEDRGESWGIGIASPRFPVGRQPLSITVKFVALTGTPSRICRPD
jgi:hypothetical protein